MKARLVNGGAESLGGEFFLADNWLLHKTWTAGQVAADEAQSVFSNATGKTAPRRP